MKIRIDTHHRARRVVLYIIMLVALLSMPVSSALAVPAAIPQALSPSDTYDMPPANPNDPLRVLADNAGSFTRPQEPFLIGTIARNGWDSTDQGIAKKEFNILTSENAMKPDTVWTARNSWNFNTARQHVEFAEKNNMVYHGHVLVWHSQTPGWMSSASWTRETLIQAMYDHIDKTMGEFKGRIPVWDVVNEAFSDSGGYRTSDSVWYKHIGKDFIELAFKRARQADPSAKLIYNDYNLSTSDRKFNDMYAMVEDFVKRGVPIDGVGFQMHIAGENTANATAFTESYVQGLATKMQKLADLGLEIYITELDVRFNASDNRLSSSQAAVQANVVKRVAEVCYAQPACKAIQVWGISDKHSWIPTAGNDFKGQGGALIYDQEYKTKPAYDSLKEVLTGEATFQAIGPLDENDKWGGTLFMWTHASGPINVWKATLTFPGNLQTFEPSHPPEWFFKYTRDGQKIIIEPSAKKEYVYGLSYPAPSIFFTISGQYQPPTLTYEFGQFVTLQASPASQAIHLNWDIDGTLLPGDFQDDYYTKIDYYTDTDEEPFTVINDYDVSSVVLTENVQNDQLYTVDLYAMLGETLWMSNTVQVMPSGTLTDTLPVVYLPLLMSSTGVVTPTGTLGD